MEQLDFKKRPPSGGLFSWHDFGKDVKERQEWACTFANGILSSLS